jgi:hypothetical protein
MELQVTRGASFRPSRYVIFGPEGVGKTTLAAQWPNPVFIDTEDGTRMMDVPRLPRPTSVPHLMGILDAFRKNPMGFKSLIIDTVDWLQDIFIESALAQTGLKAMGWNKEHNAYTVLYREWTHFLEALNDIKDTGIFVVLVAHTSVKKRDVPEEFGAFDQYQLKLLSGAGEKVKEWADYLWFVNMKVLVIKDGEGNKAPLKATNSGRVIFTNLSAVWSAKSKTQVPDEIFFTDGKLPEEVRKIITRELEGLATPNAAPAPPAPTSQLTPMSQLLTLMEQDGVTREEMIAMAASRGHFPADMEFESLPDDYITGRLIPNWTKVLKAIRNTANV